MLKASDGTTMRTKAKGSTPIVSSCAGTDSGCTGLGHGDGDCDSDSDCAAGLTCGTNNCADFRSSTGWSAVADGASWDLDDDCCYLAEARESKALGVAVDKQGTYVYEVGHVLEATFSSPQQEAMLSQIDFGVVEYDYLAPSGTCRTASDTSGTYVRFQLSEQACKDACTADSTCVAIEHDPTRADDPPCELHSEAITQTSSNNDIGCWVKQTPVVVVETIAGTPH